VTAQVTLPPIVKQLYTRAMGVPQAGRAAGDPLGVWDDFFERLHLELTSFLTHDIMNNGKEGTSDRDV